MINEKQIQGVKNACAIAKETLDYIKTKLVAGVTTKYISDLCAAFFEKRGAESACLHKNFPEKTCISINEIVCHGVPNNQIIHNSDLVNIDIAVYYQGYYGDTARTFCMPECLVEHKNLSNFTKKVMEIGISQIRHGASVGNIGHAMELYVKKNSTYNMVTNFCGHGIGEELHQEPQIPNTGFPNKGPRLITGMTITVEPVIALKNPANKILSDNWTVVTLDKSFVAQWEHTILVTNKGYEILT